MNNKRILIITHHLLPYTHSLGGVSRIVNFINFLSSKNYEIPQKMISFFSMEI